ncbi:hypothetical protein CEUSTIGMA_g10664.t1 [Chlamydomonas eustigma]|uniref:Opioid growth factor receptor (OGFr) conserved domain-containing protein n=1 Tax=Chlamydomonas eustigma TaxID=1157962 RepID=A0A250XJJ3_9CHLO|nr:hypothetical protein CEUSTIGMA_g10664.t1 [Chlamydomonas eustigma]|eukprot:GAX83238.1 hypothetical protein CEUSTIGMA_g10664.t1 [Chlamydomonas eustigma]
MRDVRELENDNVALGREERTSQSSLIVRFYRDGAQDTLQRTLAQMLKYDHLDMERCHDHMQWMFPLHEPSMFATEYEILSEKDVTDLRASDVAKSNMRAALEHFRCFLGLGFPFDRDQWEEWASNGNHNLLRITRVIRSLRLFGLEEEAHEFYEAAMQAAEMRNLSKVTKSFWKNALDGPVMGPLQSGRGGLIGADPGGLPANLLRMLFNGGIRSRND